MSKNRAVTTDVMIDVLQTYLRKNNLDVTVRREDYTPPPEDGADFKPYTETTRGSMIVDPLVFDLKSEVHTLEVVGFCITHNTPKPMQQHLRAEIQPTIYVIKEDRGIVDSYIIKSKEDMETQLPNILKLKNMSPTSASLVDQTSDTSTSIPPLGQTSDIIGLLQSILASLIRIEHKTSAGS